ncbi:MAG: hypothetical protein DRJ60_07095 [Thermoprotei archaeon]|nr:MAG: hypothetical protein DRJ60_07095 [Thermoprotei archaeon]
MLLEVILEDDVSCPRCAKLEPMLRRICDELNIPFIIRYLGNKSVAAYEESVATHTFSPEWIERYGLPEHKKSLKKIKPVLRYLQRIGAQAFPNVIIRWHDGIRTKEIVIRGFDPDSKEAKSYISNLYVLLKTLRKVVYRR